MSRYKRTCVHRWTARFGDGRVRAIWSMVMEGAKLSMGLEVGGIGLSGPWQGSTPSPTLKLPTPSLELGGDWSYGGVSTGYSPRIWSPDLLKMSAGVSGSLAGVLREGPGAVENPERSLEDKFNCEGYQITTPTPTPSPPPPGPGKYGVPQHMSHSAHPPHMSQPQPPHGHMAMAQARHQHQLALAQQQQQQQQYVQAQQAQQAQMAAHSGHAGHAPMRYQPQQQPMSGVAAQHQQKYMQVPPEPQPAPPIRVGASASAAGEVRSRVPGETDADRATSGAVEEAQRLAREKADEYAKDRKKRRRDDDAARMAAEQSAVDPEDATLTTSELKKKRYARRLALNRESAAVSRVRRREYVKELEEKLVNVEREKLKLQGKITAMDDENSRLRQQMTQLQSQLGGSKPGYGSAPPAPPLPGPLGDNRPGPNRGSNGPGGRSAGMY